MNRTETPNHHEPAVMRGSGRPTSALMLCANSAPGQDMSTIGFKAYVDESGDEGFVFRPDGSGSSRWMVLSAIVIRKEKDMALVRLLSDVRQLLAKQPKQQLHFSDLRHEQRVPYIRKLAAVPLRTVSVIIHKPSIREPERFQAEKFLLYRYATRLLLERISWLCRDHADPAKGGAKAEVIFSNRSIMSYEDLRDYLLLLKNQSNPMDVRIDWNAIDPQRVSAICGESRQACGASGCGCRGLQPFLCRPTQPLRRGGGQIRLAPATHLLPEQADNHRVRPEILAGRLPETRIGEPATRGVRRRRSKMMQTPGSSIPPIRAATVASDLYKSCACLREHCTPVARLPSTPPHDGKTFEAKFHDTPARHRGHPRGRPPAASPHPIRDPFRRHPPPPHCARQTPNARHRAHH